MTYIIDMINLWYPNNMDLLRFQKPSRYINREWNAVYREGDIRIALCFPDVYEIGMSHLGLKILYEILNSMDGVSAERVFAPWPDMEDYLKNNGKFLRSLESKRPLKDFDIIGFSLQYELSITTVLSMLELGGVPVLREARQGLPIVIAGGPCTVNPAPFNKFFDALFIGEAEYSIKELVEALRYWKKDGDGKRESLLKALSLISGFYVPGVSSSVKRVIVYDLDDAPYPLRPVVAHQAVHDRLNIEISRGCPRGCRFCQAGMIYRPVRERSVKRLLEIAELSLPLTGYEEVSFTSLSAGDYSQLSMLLEEFNGRFGNSHIALSLPSLRVKAVRKEILRLLKAERKTGFTIAPEAGTERLRAIINKDFNDEDYERALRELFEEGWLNLKLYFMIGLPEETAEDLDGIINMSLKALSIAKRYTRRFVNISVGVSPFVPKPHTPFQWFGQTGLDELKQKNNYLKEALKRKGFNYREHNPEMSLIEAIISRADERVGELILKAWALGARLEAWSEFFDFSRWIKAMDLTGIEGLSIATNTYPEDAVFPWDMVDIGIEKAFLLREYKKAKEGKRSYGCDRLCSGCGLKCPDQITTASIQSSTHFPITSSTTLTVHPKRSLNCYFRHRRIRAEFSKTGDLKYLSHLELMRLIERALRRARIALSYTEGFHPSPKISFGPALPVGVEGLREYLDMIVETSASDPDLSEMLNIINNSLPQGLRINKLFFVPAGIESLSSFVKAYEYRIKINEPELRVKIEESLKTLQIPEIRQFSLSERELRLLLVDSNQKKVKIMDLIKNIVKVERLLYNNLEIVRTGLFGFINGNLISPDEV